MCRVQTVLALLLLLVVGLGNRQARAQDNNLARIYYADVKTGHGAEFEAALQKHAAWRKQQGDPWTWTTYQVVNGENLGDFYIRSGDHTWADFDAYTEFSAKGGMEFNKTVTPHTDGISSTISTVDVENSMWPEDPSSVNLLSVTLFHLKPGQEPVFNQAVTQAVTVIKEHNRPVHFGFENMINGLNAGAVAIIEAHENWASMQGPEEGLGEFMMRVMGQEDAMKLFQQFDSTYHTAESMVLMVRPDLSVMPDM